MSEGQQLAVEQLRDLERASMGLIEVLEIIEAKEDDADGWLWATISLDCEEYPRDECGLDIKSRERFYLAIPRDFPMAVPALIASHFRWAGAPHVFWGNSLCLYQSPATEWDSSDGLYGFFQRIEVWLRHAAAGELNPTGQPLHPPATMRVDIRDTIIPQVDTPPVVPGDRPWIGFARLESGGEGRFDLVEWLHVIDETPPENAALAILLAEEMPYEFPKILGELLTQLEKRGISDGLLGLLLRWTRQLQTKEGSPLRIVIGTPMRGVAGGERHQHLTIWRIEGESAKLLGEALELLQPPNECEGEESLLSRQPLKQALDNWAAVTPISWCRVLENRAEVTVRRDTGSVLTWFSGKNVTLWGCGALGSHIAEALVRAGVAKLHLVDNSIVKPGILVRQLFEDSDIGRPKVHALEARLRRIRPSVTILSDYSNVVTGSLSGDDWMDGTDIIIDATASRTVLAKMEQCRRRVIQSHGHESCVPIASLVIGHDARDGFAVVSGKDFTGAPDDICRKAKLALFQREENKDFLGEFFPQSERLAPFQPEPGCSENTFTGSAADVAFLSAGMLNAVAQAISQNKPETASAYFLHQPSWSGKPEASFASFHWDPDHIYWDCHTGYEVRMTAQAWADLLHWVEDSRKVRGSASETGGLLFGEYDDAAKIIWVRHVLGPPPDSEHSPSLFVCGIEGTREAAEELDRNSGGSNRYVGMWHTHPKSLPAPSPVDRDGMERLLSEAPIPPRRTLLFILGRLSGRSSVGAYVFSRQDFLPGNKTWFRLCSINVLEDGNNSASLRRVKQSRARPNFSAKHRRM